MQNKRKILVVLVDRANYGRLEPVMHAVQAHEALELSVLCSGSMVLPRFGRSVDVVKSAGFPVDAEIFMEIEGSNPMTMAKSVGLSVMECANAYHRLQPDIVLMIGDRFEALGAAIAAAYMNLPLVHIQGGEVSGSIDESARHAISKLAQFHVPSTERARTFLLRMGERVDTILTVGCPSSDIARELDVQFDSSLINDMGGGATIDCDKPYGLVVYHPTTTEYAHGSEGIKQFLDALANAEIPLVMLWPNIDAGSQQISKLIRTYRTEGKFNHIRFLTNLSPTDYLKVLGRASVAIGNSSSFVRDAGYFGTPVVLVGNRQQGRESDVHVTQVRENAESILACLQEKRIHGRYEPSTLYGDGQVSERVANALATLEPYSQKRLDYPEIEYLD